MKSKSKREKVPVGRSSRTVESSNSTVGLEPTTRTNRSPRNPTPRRLKVPVGRWKARVKVTSKGPNRADRQRKVDNTRTVQVPLDDVLGDLIARLRSGEDVRFTLNGREALRVFPCLSADYETMYAAVNTTGELKSCLKDVEFEMVDKDQTAIRPETAKAERSKRNELIHVRKEEDRNGVVPKRVLKCWNCGAENVISGFGNN